MRITVILALLLVMMGKASPQTITENHPAFADALMSELYENDNECTSTWGISMAFSLIYPSSTGNSENQIRSVLRYPLDKLQLVWNDTSNRLDELYSGQCLDSSASSNNGMCDEEAPTLEIANSVWLDDTGVLDPTYTSIVGDLLLRTDFDSEEAGGVVNAWVNETTRGLIDSIVPEGNLSRYILIAINSIYLKASWIFQFPERYTNEDLFYASASKATALDENAQFMHQVEFFPYLHNKDAGYQMVRLPFAGRDLSMIFVLPTRDDTEMVTSTSVLEAFPNLVDTRVALALPKFKFESEYADSLESALQALGIVAPFSGGLCVVENSCDAFIDFVIQKTVIDVNEKGVEAAAVTAIGVIESGAPSDPPVLFLADHPFQFFIYDRTEELVLFEGRFGKPEIPPEAPAAQLSSKHTDEDFWTSNFGVDPILPDVSTLPPTTQPSSSAFEVKTGFVLVLSGAVAVLFL